MRLTEKTIKAIPAAGAWKEADCKRGYRLDWDDACVGLGLRTTANGVKAFVYNYRTVDGRQRRATVGRWPAMTATAARASAAKFQSKIAVGGDPLAATQARRGALRFAELVAEFASRHLSDKRSGGETERLLRSDAIPVLGPLTASGVKRRDIIALIEAKAKTAPVAANRLASAISRMYNWAIKRDILEVNPAAFVPKVKEAGRDRVLNESELVTFWERLDGAPRIGKDIADALCLVLMTLARPGEVAGLRWDEISAGWWEIPGSRTKNGRSHRIPLNRLALEILERRERTGEYCFPSDYRDHMQRLSLSHALRRSQDHFGMPRFTPHDLRRTAASHIAALGVPRFIVERLLNHTDRSVTGRYDRYEYSAETRDALEKWDHKLRALLHGEMAEVVEFLR